MFLVDLNVLIALAHGHHEHHVVAARWMRTVAQMGWRTCPLVDAGFVRVISSTRLAPTITPKEAHQILARFKSLPGYDFVPDDIDLRDPTFEIGRVQGSNQVTDAYLVALCRKHGLKLATFDGRIESTLAPGEGIVENL